MSGRVGFLVWATGCAVEVIAESPRGEEAEAKAGGMLSVGARWTSEWRQVSSSGSKSGLRLGLGIHSLWMVIEAMGLEKGEVLAYI